jgi:CIC family chloride channel protein
VAFVRTIRGRWERRRAEIRELASRSRQVLLLAALVGGASGFLVAGFEAVVVEVLLEPLLDMPLWVLAVAPGVGLAIAAAMLRWVGGGSGPATADEYIKAFHHPGHPLPIRSGIARLLAAIATLGSGGAMGLEGPSIFFGSTIGLQVHERMPPKLRGERRTLLVAGAAAGVAAIFKAPATGAVFALEVPFQDDLARKALLPALVGAASGYLAFASIHGTSPLIPVEGDFGFNGRDIAGALVLGVLAGIGARWFARGLREAKQIATVVRAPLRVIAASAGLVLVFVATRLVAGESLSVASGYDVVAWALEPDHGILVLFGVLVLRCLATVFAVGGGGVGGIFIPLVVAGSLAGSMVGSAVNDLETPLFVVIGIAAFLGAGYRVPLAAVMFVAETTGKASIVVPGLFAAVAAELMMGRSSVTNMQRTERGAIAQPGFSVTRASPDPPNDAD